MIDRLACGYVGEPLSLRGDWMVTTVVPPDSHEPYPARSSARELSPLPGFRVRTHSEQHGDVVVVSAAGEIDIHTAGRLVDQALAAAAPLHPPRLILDLDQITFCDSSGLGAIVAIWKALRACGGVLTIARPPALCRRILQRTGLDQHIAVSPTIRHALADVTSR